VIGSNASSMVPSVPRIRCSSNTPLRGTMTCWLDLASPRASFRTAPGGGHLSLPHVARHPPSRVAGHSGSTARPAAPSKNASCRSASELTLSNRQSLLRIDLLDQRKFPAGRVDKVKRLRPALMDIRSPSVASVTLAPLATSGRFEHFLPGMVMSRPAERSRARCYELHLEIGASDVETVVSR